MTGAGKKLRGGGARRNQSSPAPAVSDGGYGRPPHPLRLMSGQVFWPRAARRQRPLVVTRVFGDRVQAKRLDPPYERVDVSAGRLLARREDGQGRHYSFQGWSSRRYRTWAQVAWRDGPQAILVVPEWHPSRPVRVLASALPIDAREPESWLTVSADLSHASASQLELQAIARCETPAPDVCHRPEWRSNAAGDEPRLSEYGAGCGDIVLELGEQQGAQTLTESRFFVGERPGEMKAGGRVYLPRDGAVAAYRRLIGDRPGPNGVWLDCEPELHTLERPIPLDGINETGGWRWRWWPRAVEQTGCGDDVSRYRYEPREHRGGYVWRRGGAVAPSESAAANETPRSSASCLDQRAGALCGSVDEPDPEIRKGSR